jgi:hypothetical protein
MSVAPHITKIGTGPSTPPTVIHLDLRGDEPATLRRLGSFNYDKENGAYPHKWSSLADFNEWCRDEELAYSIELISLKIMPGNTLWTEKRYYVCSRGHSGGTSKYQKKYPERQRKIESKKMGCCCKLLIKLYPHTSNILGCYQDEHNHEIGIANIAYMRMSHTAREQIKSMLEQKIDPREIVHKTNS